MAGLERRIREGPGVAEDSANPGADAVGGPGVYAGNAAMARLLAQPETGGLLAEAVVDPHVSNHAVTGLLESTLEPPAGGSIVPPAAGRNGIGFIDNGEGANVRTGPFERGGQTLRWLPPSTQVYVNGAYPGSPEWSYVTAYLADGMFRGYVQQDRVATDLPEPTATLHQIRPNDTAEGLARLKFAGSVQPGLDLRFYENVLLYVNQQAGRAGIAGTFQDPGLLGGSDNIKLVAGHRIWLVSPQYAQAVKDRVPSGSLTGGAIAGARQFAQHFEDILESVKRSPEHARTVLGEYLDVIAEHYQEIIGVVAAFIAAEMLSASLATVPGGQILALLIQLVLAVLNGGALVKATVDMLDHGTEWLKLAWSASGDPAKIAAASREFLRMLLSIVIGVLAVLGLRANVGRALGIARSMPPPSAGLALATAGGPGGVTAGTAVQVGPPGLIWPVAPAAAMANSSDRGGGGSRGAGPQSVKTDELRSTHSIGGADDTAKVVQLRNIMELTGRKWPKSVPPIDVVIHKGVMYIVDGHHRLAAAKLAGVREVLVNDVTEQLVNGGVRGYRDMTDVLAGARAFRGNSLVDDMLK
jgi:hypothetical protein